MTPTWTTWCGQRRPNFGKDSRSTMAKKSIVLNFGRPDPRFLHTAVHAAKHAHAVVTELEITSEPGVIPLQTQSANGNLSPELIQKKPDLPNGSSRRRSSFQLAFLIVISSLGICRIYLASPGDDSGTSFGSRSWKPPAPFSWRSAMFRMARRYHRQQTLTEILPRQFFVRPRRLPYPSPTRLR